jgi:hypothetical protein
MRRPHCKRAWLTVCAGLVIGCGALVIGCAGLAAPALAGTATGQFPVRITLANPLYANAPAGAAAGAAATGAFCVNQALSQATQATVTVVCSTNQFVSIQPVPGASFLGTDAGAYRFLLRPDVYAQPADLTWQAGMGTITTLQIVRKKRSQWEITEIQISY